MIAKRHYYHHISEGDIIPLKNAQGKFDFFRYKGFYPLMILQLVLAGPVRRATLAYTQERFESLGEINFKRIKWDLEKLDDELINKIENAEYKLYKTDL